MCPEFILTLACYYPDFSLSHQGFSTQKHLLSEHRKGLLVTLIIWVAILTGRREVRKQSCSITPLAPQFLISAFEMILWHPWARDWINNEQSRDTQCPIQPDITLEWLCSGIESRWGKIFAARFPPLTLQKRWICFFSPPLALAPRFGALASLSQGISFSAGSAVWFSG